MDNFFAKVENGKVDEPGRRRPLQYYLRRGERIKLFLELIVSLKKKNTENTTNKQTRTKTTRDER
jgi:hypothetical protein